jgi:hypothetical protein
MIIARTISRTPAFLGVLLFGLLPACGSQAANLTGQGAQERAQAATPYRTAAKRPAKTPAKATPPSPTTSAKRDCYFKVDGKVRLSGSCLVYPMGADGSYTLNTWDKGKPAQSHFAVVSVTGSGVADATWNKDPEDDRALDPLGTVRFVQGCWQNARAKICAR